MAYLKSGNTTDATAIHDDTASEISTVANKETLADADYILIEDSADSNDKKHVTAYDARRQAGGKHYYFDDFFGADLDQDLWTTGGVNGTVTISDDLGGGVVAMATGATADNTATLISGKRQYSAANNSVFRVRVKTSATSNGDWWWCLYDGGSGHYAKIEFDTSSSANIRCISYDGAGTETTTTDTAGDTSWHTYEIITAAASVIFKQDGVTLATHTTRVPGNYMYADFRSRARSNSNKILYIDWIELESDRE